MTHLSTSLLTIIIFIQGSKCCRCMHMAPFVTFRGRGNLQSLHHTDIQQHGLFLMIGSLVSPLSASSSSLSWALRESVQAAAATSLLSDCHSSIALSPLTAHGVPLAARDLLSQTASSCTAREPSASADIFQGPFQQMEFLQVPFGVKYLASGYSIWSITNWIMYSISPLHFTSPTSITSALSVVMFRLKFQCVILTISNLHQQIRFFPTHLVFFCLAKVYEMTQC